jgi:hypothetical protein
MLAGPSCKGGSSCQEMGLLCVHARAHGDRKDALLSPQTKPFMMQSCRWVTQCSTRACMPGH